MYFYLVILTHKIIKYYLLLVLSIILIINYIHNILEKLIKSACLNTAQNLISEINIQKESFLTFTKRLIEVRKENSSESISHGMFNTM